MDPHRFDSITRAFTTRLSRRSAVRAGGAGVAVALAASVGFGAAPALTTATSMQMSTPYSAIRKYVLTGPTDAAVQALNGYVAQIQQQAGFLSYSVVASDPNTLTTVSVFDTPADFSAAEQNLGGWVSENLASLLPAATENTAGSAVIFTVNANTICGPAATPVPTQAPCTGDGCACNGGVQNNCDEGLVCCQGADAMPGGPGICTAEAACAPAACTGIGCSCNSGVENACDEGLVCCQSAMGGGSIPGGEGMCAAADACGDEAATPVN